MNYQILRRGKRDLLFKNGDFFCSFYSLQFIRRKGKNKATLIPVASSIVGSTIVCLTNDSMFSVIGFKESSSAILRSLSVWSILAPRVISMSLVSRGSPYRSTACPPIIIYGRRYLLRHAPILERISSNMNLRLSQS